MSTITLDVRLLSGRTVTVQVGIDEDVATLKCRAQTALGVGTGRLVDSFGNVLDASAPIKVSKLHDGDSLTLHLGRVRVCSDVCAFAAILGDGSVEIWGDPCRQAFAAKGVVAYSAVRDQLKTVQQIKSSDFAFAAILDDGSVVTWGDVDFGGDSSAVQDQLKNVEHVQATQCAFAAILRDGSVVTWGDQRSGGCSSDVRDQLNTVQQIQASSLAFAAILGEGSVVTWG